MSELLTNVVFQEVSCMFKDEAFSAMYFGRHFEKNILVLKHNITVMIVLGDDLQWSAPEFTKAVSFRGERRKGKHIVGNENVILLLDEDGNLWSLINAFEASTETGESFHSLNEECYYEWAPFKKFNCKKVFAVSAMDCGFACIGLSRNSERKLLLLRSLDSTLEDYTFDELNTSEIKSFSYYLTTFSMNTKNPTFMDAPAQETLLVSDRNSGKTYICTKNGMRNSLINVSNIFLICALHFQQENCLMLCFENGKLVFHFYNDSQKQNVLYLSKKIVFVDRCCCSDSCLLWSNGITLNHTKLTFQHDEDLIRLSHLKLNCPIQGPLSIVNVNQNILAVTINNIYYCLSPGVRSGREIRRQPQEVLSDIYNGSCLIGKLEAETDVLAHYLQCKDIIQRGRIKERTQIKWEGNGLAIKTDLGISLREELWKVQLMTSVLNKTSVRVVDLEADLRKEALILIEKPFKNKCKVKASLIGDFREKDLFLYLGESDELESDSEKDQLSKQIQKILKKRNQSQKREV